MFDIKFRQRYSARQLSPKTLSQMAASMLTGQLHILRAVTYREGYPRVWFPRHQPAMRRSSGGSKVVLL
jgi:hypothetical protein